MIDEYGVLDVMADPDDIGFLFDPFELDLTNTFPDADHFEEVLCLRFRWKWVDGQGREIDLRKIPLSYLINLIEWMQNNSTTDTPYTDTEQYTYCLQRHKKMEFKIELARRSLSRRMGWSKTNA